MGSTLPIIVYYGGRADLDEDKAAILEKFSNTLVVDLFSILPSLDNTGITGWAMKPFVMASSPFEEVLFMDADVGFFQDPAVMFDMEGYKRAGSVFFHDRLINEGKRKIHGWLETFLLEKSPDASQVQMLNHYMTNHEQESGIVVINKQSTAFYGLLLASAMLTPPYQATVYSYSLGDKETFWISAELLKIPYYFVSGYGGAVGYLNPDLENSVCGNLYHPDEDWQPLWWNGGVHINRHRTWWPPFNFFHELIHFIMMRPTKTFYDEMTHWVTNKLGEEGYWTYEIPNQPYCFSPRNFKANSGLLTPREQRLVKETIQGAKHVHSAQDDLKKLKPV